MRFPLFQLLGIWLRGLLSLIVLGIGVYLLSEWSDRDAADADSNGFGLNWATALLVGGLLLIGWGLVGGWLGNPRFRRHAGEGRIVSPPGGRIRRIRRSDGSELAVELYGPDDGDPIIFTHGWGSDRNAWVYAKTELDRSRLLIFWDLPGLGQSGWPADRDWSMERMARDLNDVLYLAGGKPAVLVGHSLGGMVILTFCKLFPRTLGSRVKGLVLVHATYTNPVRTASGASVLAAIQNPVLKPLCYLMIGLAPVVRALNWLSYISGAVHRLMDQAFFSGRETRAQLEYFSRYVLTAPPGVIARGMLGMFRYDATDVLKTINVPVLVVAGDQDQICVPEASRFMARTIPDAELLMLSPAKHCGHFEHHQWFHDALERFLESNRQAGDPNRQPTNGPARSPGKGPESPPKTRRASAAY